MIQLDIAIANASIAAQAIARVNGLVAQVGTLLTKGVVSQTPGQQNATVILSSADFLAAIGPVPAAQLELIDAAASATDATKLAAALAALS